MSKQNKTIQQKLAELGEMVAWFDSERFALEEALEKFKAAEKMAEEIESDLAELKNEVVVLRQKFTEDQ